MSGGVGDDTDRRTVMITEAGRGLVSVAGEEWADISLAVAAIEAEAFAAGQRACASDPRPRPDTGLDVDNLDSIMLALDTLPTWFPEARAKVQAMRAALASVSTGSSSGINPDDYVPLSRPRPDTGLDAAATCERAWGTSGTVCFTHGGRFASPEATLCEYAPLAVTDNPETPAP